MFHGDTRTTGTSKAGTTISQAQALEYFEQFMGATTLKNILGYFRTMCELIHLKPTYLPLFYPKLKAMLNGWKAKAIWKKLDSRANHKCYGKGKIGEKTRVLVIGGGPCGLRTAIEAQLLGCKVVVVEKRDRLSRNNVLHLWPFVIEDLRALGAKKFFGKFCAGAIDHISIRQLQCILLKVALVLGVEIHTEVSFESLVEPSQDEKIGWRAQVKPSDHPVSQYEFDVIIGADGKRNTLTGFKRKEFRGKLAIAITANFINKRTEAEARVEEISGVAFIFNQKFFKDLYHETGIDLENIVYYKDETHYFVMTAKKTSLIEKGVILQDLAETERLLAPDNVNREALLNYAKEAADFSTNYQMSNMEFAVNHYGQPDVAMFDFTSMYAAENASKVLERNGYQLLMILVGDSLLEPFWPTGSGCARGFLSSLDAAWAIRTWSLGKASPLEVLAERESTYRLLAQTTPDNLNKDWKSYTLDPSTRYPNLNRATVTPHQLVSLYDTDDIQNIEKLGQNVDKVTNISRKRRREIVDSEILIEWVKRQVESHPSIKITDLSSIFHSGKVLCAIINHYRPDLIDYSSIVNNEATQNNQLAIDVLEKDIGISPIMTGQEITSTQDNLALTAYLTQIYDVFKSEIPHVKHPKLELPESKNTVTSFKTLLKEPSAVIASNVASRPSSRHKRHVEGILSNKSANIERKTRKRRTLDKSGSVAEIQKQFEEGNSSKSSRLSKRQQQRKRHAEHFIKSMQMLAANAKPDCPFEDYSIFVYRQTARNFEDRVKDLEKKFTYIPEYDTKVPSLIRTNTDDEFAAKIKSIEEGWQSRQLVEKKPKDLMRKIGKIETSDWNIKEIEKKIKENKLGKPIVRDKEKVPKWSREQFVARQTKLEKLDRQDSAEAKYADIDKNLKHLELKLKEGTNRDLGQNKIASITEKLTSKIPEPPEPVVPKSVDKPVIIPSYSGSEFCHFCNKRVYLMERLSAEGRFFHHGCFKCQYCRAQLRLGSYAFDKDGIYGHKFFCLHHYGMQGKAPTTTKVARKPSQRDTKPTSKKLTGVSGVDLLDRVRTPERAEFSNLSLGSSDLEDSISQMDEDEWTDRNFGASTAEIGSSDDEDDSSSYSDTDSDDEDAYEEAMEEPATKEGTLKWAERMSKRHYSKQDKSDSEPYGSSDSSSYYENSTDDDESDTATEGEEEIRARELRLQEVRLEPPIIQADTGTDTEVKCNSKTSDNLNLSHSETQCSDPRFSQNSSSNSINSTDFDSALEDNFDINFNNVISKNEVNAPINHSSIDSGDDSATISRSEPNSNVTVIERTLDKNVDNSDCIIDENNKQIPRSSETISASLENNEVVLTEVCDLTDPNGKNSQSEENCVSPSIKMSKKFFGSAFVPTFQKEEPEPLLVIKRTPSKINLPKEVGKPKVAVNKNIEENAKKYFGAPPKPTLRRSSTARNIPKPKVSDRSYFKSSSLNSHFSFNFEPEEEDLKNTDDYIEQLLKNEKELMKPIDPDKFRRLYETDENEQKKSDSIDDLLEALEMETYDDVFEHSIMKEKDEKIEKLLQWMDDVVHQEDNINVPGKLKGDSGKYDNLEAILKTEKTAAPVAKLAKNNIKYFDELLAGKNSEAEDEVPARKFSWTRNDVDNHLAKHRTSLDLDAIKKVNIKNVLRKFESMDYTNDDGRANMGDVDHVGERKKPSLTRSKTEIHFNKPRTSVDLDAVSKVDIKQVLKKFENADKKEDSPVLPRRRSSSFANFKKSNLKVKDDPKKCSDEKIVENSRVTNIRNEYSENETKENSSSDPIEKTPEKCLNETDSFFNMQVKVNYEQYPMEYTNSYEPDLKVYPNEDATNILGISDKDIKSILESQVEETDLELKNQKQNICEITSQNNPVFKPEECEGDAINNIANIQNCRNENTQNEISSKKNSDSLTKNQILSEYDPTTTFKNESSIQSNEIITSDVIPPEEKYDSGSVHSEKEIKDQENETNTDTNKEELGKRENIIPVLEYKVFDKIQQDLDEMIGSLNDMDDTNRKSLEVEEPAQIESSKTSKTVISNSKNNDINISHSDSKNINEGETNIRCDESDKPDTLENEPKKENIKSDIEQNGTNYGKLERIENNNNNFSLLKQEVFDEVRKISDSVHTENGIKDQEKETNTHTNKEEVGKTENIIPVLEHKVFDKIQQELDEMVGSLNDMVATNEESLYKEKTSGGVLNEEIDTFKNQLNAKNTDTTTEIPVSCHDKSPINENMSYDAHINSEKSVSKEHSSEVKSNAPPVPIRTKYIEKTPPPPPQRPQRKRSLEQRNRESVERTRYVPTEEKLKNLERIKKERITKHQSPKAQKCEIQNLNSSSESKDKECSIQ